MPTQNSRLFDVYLAVDWSARSVPSPAKPVRDAIWVGEKMATDLSDPTITGETYWRTRATCFTHLQKRLQYHASKGRKVLVGFDFAFGYPEGYVAALGLDDRSQPAWRSLWHELTRLIEDQTDNANNRFTVAAELNARCSETSGPLWGCPVGLAIPNLSPTSPGYPFVTKQGISLERLRWADKRISGVQPGWKLMGIGSVGSQSLLGIPVVNRLLDDPVLAAVSYVWPFETGFTTQSLPQARPLIVYAEIWPGIVQNQLDPAITIRDQAQVKAVVDWVANLDQQHQLSPLFETPSNLSEEAIKAAIKEEGWILGAN